MHKTVYTQGQEAYKHWLAKLEAKADKMLLDVELLKPQRLERSTFLAFEFLDYVKTMLRKKRVHIQLRTVERQPRPAPPPDCTRWGWSSEDAAPKTPCIGWYDVATDTVLLMPEQTVDEVRNFVTNVFRYYGRSPTTVGNRLRDAGVLVSRDKHRDTVRRKINGEGHKVWVIPAAVFSDE